MYGWLKTATYKGVMSTCLPLIYLSTSHVYLSTSHLMPPLYVAVFSQPYKMDASLLRVWTRLLQVSPPPPAPLSTGSPSPLWTPPFCVSERVFYRPPLPPLDPSGPSPWTPPWTISRPPPPWTLGQAWGNRDQAIGGSRDQAMDQAWGGSGVGRDQRIRRGQEKVMDKVWGAGSSDQAVAWGAGGGTRGQAVDP